MVKRRKTPRRGLTPGKTILIGILSVVLLLVVVMQFGGRKRRGAAPPVARQAASKRAESTRSPAQAAAATEPQRSATQRSENPWPTFNVAEVVASNPFMLPEVLQPRRQTAQTLTPSPAAGETEVIVPAIEVARVREMRRRQAEFMAGLREQGVDMILRSPRGSVARIGAMSLRVGDVHEGLRVVEIGTNGVVFAPTAAALGQPQ